MARRTFQMIDVVEILQHWHAGRPKVVIAASLGVDPKTVRKYVAPAEAAGIVPGEGAGPDRAGWAAHVAAWFPELGDARARSRTWPELDARRELIISMLETNTLATVHQRLRDEYGLTVSTTSLRRYVWQVLPDRRPGARPVTVLRPDVPPGEGQIDYGYLGRWVDPVGGRSRRVQAFVVVLACSRHMFIRPVLSMDQSSWTAAHVAAWEFFGGVPGRLVVDNLEDRGAQGRPLRSAAEPGLCRDGRALRRTGRPGPGAQAQVQSAGGADDAVHPGLVLAGPQLRQPGRHAGPGRRLVPAGRRRPLPPRHGQRQPAVGVSRRRGLGVAPAAGPGVRTGPLGLAEGRPGLSHRGREGALLGAVRPCREDHRHPVSDRAVAVHVDGALVKTWPKATRGRCTDPGDYPPEKIAFFARNPVWCRHKARE